MVNSENPLPIAWIENPYTPVFSGVWRYNFHLKGHLLKHHNVNVVYSNHITPLEVNDTGRRNQIVSIVDNDSVHSNDPVLKVLRFLASKPSTPYKVVRGLAGAAGFDAFTLYMRRPFRFGNHLPQGTLVHITDQYMATKIPRKRPYPVIISVMDIMPYISEQLLAITLHEQPRHKRLYAQAMRKLKSVDGIIAISEFTKETLVQYADIDESKIKVIYCGVDRERFLPGLVPPKFIEKYGLNTEQKLILHISNESPHKNFQILLRAFQKILVEHPHAVLLKVGEAHEQKQRETHIQLCHALNISHAVKFLDQVEDEELVYFYRVADVFVFPSLAEGFGLPILESLACGTPIVCSNAWSLPEVGGDAAIFVEPSDVNGYVEAIDRILVDEDFREDLIQRGIKHAKQFTWQTAAEQTYQYYKEIQSRA